MGDQKFHEKKIEEILNAYTSSESLFVRGVCLFYLAVHSIDWVLAQHGVSPSTHRGRRNLITQYLDEFSFSKFDQLLSASIRVRYTEHTTEGIVREMNENLKELISHLKENHSLSHSVADRILKNL